MSFVDCVAPVYDHALRLAGWRRLQRQPYLWGARRGTARSNRDGARMAAFLDAHPDRKLLNSRTNQPTRFCADSVRRKIKLSCLDLTLSSPALAEDLTWSVDEVDKQSDHYQMQSRISLPADWRDPDLDLMTLEETMWKLRNEPELWQAFEQQLQQRWPLLQSHLRSIQTDFRRSTADRIDSISACVERLYHEVAQSIFGRKSKREIWKRWIPKRAQFHSIQFHRFYRRFVKKRHKTHSDWRIYDTLQKKGEKRHHCWQSVVGVCDSAPVFYRSQHVQLPLHLFVSRTPAKDLYP